MRLTHCILVGSFTVICWTSLFSLLILKCHFRGVSSILLLLFYFWWKILLANNVGPDQMPHYVASELDLHCLPMTLLWVFR